MLTVCHIKYELPAFLLMKTMKTTAEIFFFFLIFFMLSTFLLFFFSSSSRFSKEPWSKNRSKNIAENKKRWNDLNEIKRMKKNLACVWLCIRYIYIYVHVFDVFFSLNLITITTLCGRAFVSSTCRRFGNNFDSSSIPMRTCAKWMLKMYVYLYV